MRNDREAELPDTLHTAEQVRARDAQAIALGVPGYVLMQRAAAAALRVLRARWPSAQRIAVVCGSGNNGGDGYVLARLAVESALQVDAIALFAPESLRGDAARAYRDFVQAGGSVGPWSEDLLRADVLIDAIFGIGLNRPVDREIAQAIVKMNSSGRSILALDIPSGLHADTGSVLGAAIKAECTVSFVGLKLGCFVGAGPDLAGEIRFDALGIEPSGPVAARRLDHRWLRHWLTPRDRTSHKGANGHVLIVGGGPGMAGAARLAGEAALRAGAGLVSIATAEENVAAVVAGRPELMVRAAHDVGALIERATVVAIGPGLGQGEWGRDLLALVLASGKPLVVDADALNLLAQSPHRRDNWILTPHPGEAGRLLGVSTSAIQSDRLSSARELTARYGGITVLKGGCTVVVGEGELPAICTNGNPGMATAGMGDVLTGVIAGLVAQTGDLWGAARAGVLVHALAGDDAAVDGERGMIASDLFPFIRREANPRG